MKNGGPKVTVLNRRFDQKNAAFMRHAHMMDRLYGGDDGNGGIAGHVMVVWDNEGRWSVCQRAGGRIPRALIPAFAYGCILNKNVEIDLTDSGYIDGPPTAPDLGA
jgi:hypothetical protein